MLLQTLPHNPSPWFRTKTARWLLANLSLGLLYLLLMALVTPAFPDRPPIWPSAAVAMLAVIIGGLRWLPGIIIATVMGHLAIMDYPMEWSLWITLGNALGLAANAFLINRFIPDINHALESGRGVALFALLTILNSAMSAGFGAFAISFSLQPETHYGAAFFSWFIADMTAILLLTPALTLWWKDLQAPCLLMHGNLEMWLAATSLIAMTAILFFLPSTDATSLLRTGIFMILLPLVWVALRFPQRSTFTLMSVVFIISVSGTLLERGVMSELASPYTRLQLILISAALITLLVSAMSVERRRIMDALNQSYATLEERINERTLQLSDNLRYLEILLDNIPIPMVITRPDQSIVIYANLAAADYGGYPLDKMIGSNSTMYFQHQENFQLLRKKLEENGSLNSHEVALRHRDGHTLWALLSAVPSRYNDMSVLIFAFQDISQAKQRELDLEQLVSTDALTRLATRRYFLQRAADLQRLADYNGQPFALLMLDLDHFKQINDTHGHPAGDKVLVSVAECFRQSLRPDDLCGRLGGEEFAVILRNTGKLSAHCGADRLRIAINNLQVTIDSGQTITPSVSIGGVIYHPRSPSEGSETAPSSLQQVRMEDLIEDADQALYLAKHSGRNCVVFV